VVVAGTIIKKKHMSQNSHSNINLAGKYCSVRNFQCMVAK